MKLTILGSGTVVPNGARNSAGYFIESSEARLMLDCGAGTVHALARYGLDWERLTHLFISHFHVDHIGELASLFFAFKHGMSTERRAPLVLIGPRGLDRVIRGLKQAFGSDLFEPEFDVQVKLLESGNSLPLGPGTLSVTKTPHTAESLAVRIEADGRVLCYTGDTGYSEDVARFFTGASLIVSECSFRERREGVPHLAVADAAKMAESAEAERLVVTHFYFDVDAEELSRELSTSFSGEVLIGRDGLAVDLGTSGRS